MIKRCLLVLILISPAALAEPAKPPASPPSPKIEGTFGFDVMKSVSTKCAKVTGALLTKLTKDYRCAPPTVQSASGVAVVASCAAKKGDSSYMLFATNHDCEEERQTQVANGN
jgi:hypothetical protein